MSIVSASFSPRARSLVAIATAALLASGVFIFAQHVFASTAGDVVINEFVPTPSSGNEWIELYNTTGSTIDLSGWTLEDGAATPHTIPLTGSIAPKGFAVFEYASSELNTVGDTITLLDNASTTIDSVAYGDATDAVVTAPDQGESAGRFPDGSNNWQLFATPTKGVTNGGPAATVTAEDFGTWDNSPSFKGINVGFKTANFTSVSSITVDIYSGSTLIAENTASSALVNDINTQQDSFGQNGQLSSPFVVSGSLNDTWCQGGPCWTPGTYTWSVGAVPTKALITVKGTDANGTATQTAENDTFSQAGGSFASFIMAPSCGSTDTVADTTFDTFTNGNINGQNGWAKTGSYDAAVVDNVYGIPSFGCKSLRISNAVTSGSFGDQTFAAPTTQAAGETASNNHYVAQFDIASTQLDEQPGLAISVSPDDGNGSRMSYLSFTDSASGIDVTFYDVQGTSNPANFVATDLGTLDRTASHTIKFDITFVPGPSNDIVKIYIDGALVHTGTTWENYYRYDSEQAGNGNKLFPIDTLIFRAGGTAAPATSGDGFLFDNVQLSTDVVAGPPAVITNPATNITLSNATLNGTVGPTDASMESFWVSTSSFATSSTHMPAGVYSTPVLNALSANSTFSDPLSIVTTNGIIWNGTSNQNVNMPAITPSTTYYYVAWADVGGKWYPGAEQSFTTAAPPDTTRPTFVYNYPLAGAFASTTLPVSVTASDTGSGVSNVAVHLYDSTNKTFLGLCGSGHSNLGGVASSTYICTLDTSSLADGTYTLRSGATDVAGNNQTVSEKFSVDNTKPTASLTAPAQGSTQTGTFMITGNATDTGSGVDHIDIYVAHNPWSAGGYVVNKQQATYNATTGAFSYSVSGISDGTYDIKAVVYDKVGNVRYALSGNSGLKIYVVNVVPNLAITAPAVDGDYATSSYTFSAQYDNPVTNTIDWAIRSGANSSCSGGTTVAGNVDGHKDTGAFASDMFTYATDTTKWADGVYCFVVNPTEPSGHGYADLRAVRTFVVDNTAPTAPSLVSPANGASVNGSSVTQAWSDTDTSIDHFIYESYNDAGATSLRWHQEFASTTLSKTATNVANSTYWWRVKAIDAAGNAGGWSDLWKLTVDNTVPAGNTDGYLILKKVTTNGTDDTFHFDIAGSSSDSVDLTTVNGSTTSPAIALTPGTFDVTEVAQDDWSLKNVSCDSGSPSSIDNGASVSIATGVTVTCTFTDEPATKLTETVYLGDLATSTSDVVANPDKWFAYNDTTDQIDSSLGAFVSGPNPAPLGNGSIQFTLGASPLDRQNIATYQFAGLPLSEITALSYSAYSHPGVAGASESPFFNFNVDLENNNTWQGRLVYVPSANGLVPQDQWNTFDMIDSGNAKWTYSHFAVGPDGVKGTGDDNSWPDGNTNEYRTWNDIMAHFPHAKILASDGWLGVRVGEPGPTNYIGNVDNFRMTVDNGSQASTVIADFEPNTGTETAITSVSPEPSIVGNAYTVSWKVTADSGATPTGTVVVTVNGGAGCSAAASAGSCQITPTSTGSADLVAKFSGDPGFDGSTSADVTHEIDVASDNGGNSNSGGVGGGGGPVTSPVLGDINGDGHVDFLDFALLMAAMGEKGNGLPADLNGDGVVDMPDLAVLFAHWTF